VRTFNLSQHDLNEEANKELADSTTGGVDMEGNTAILTSISDLIPNEFHRNPGQTEPPILVCSMGSSSLHLCRAC